MSRSLHRVQNLWGDTRAVAAVEFAITVPFMLLGFAVGFFLGIYVVVKRFRDYS